MGKLVQFKSLRKTKRRRGRKAGKRLKAIIQKEIHKGAEKKFFDNTISATGGAAPYLLDATAEVVPSSLTGAGASQMGMLPACLVGTSENQRIGDSIRVKRLSLKFRATAFSATATGVVYVVRSPEPDGVAPTIANLWSQVTDIAVANRNPNYLSDYHILGKILIQATAGTSLNRTYSWSKTYKGAGLKVVFDGATSAIDDVEQNNVFLIAQSNGSDDVISISNGIFRVEYFDM